MSAMQMSSLKAWQLKYWAFLTGAASTGTKAELQSALNKRMDLVPSSVSQAGQRIVSVDMGIRNLAFCALEVPSATGSSRPKPLKVTTWERMDLLSTTATSPEALDAVAAIDEPPSKKTKAQRQLESAIAREAFTPSYLSKTAYGVTTELLNLKPTTILIERQRFRSGGASTILEWTIRVNMLESMLWACLGTLRATNLDIASLDVQAVDPARVAHFWTEGLSGIPLRPSEDIFISDSTLGSTISEVVGKKGKVDKKAKVAIVKSWIAGKSEDVALTFEGQAAEISEAFKQARGGRLVAGGKLDDLADCLLQAVAWARWDENRSALDGLWRSMGGIVENNES